jgi:hypothetical protein
MVALPLPAYYVTRRHELVMNKQKVPHGDHRP